MEQPAFSSLGLVQLLLIPEVLSLFFMPIRNQNRKYPGKMENSDTDKAYALNWDAYIEKKSPSPPSEPGDEGNTSGGDSERSLGYRL